MKSNGFSESGVLKSGGKTIGSIIVLRRHRVDSAPSSKSDIMRTARPVAHFNMVDRAAIKPEFFDSRAHRATLFLPFIGRTSGKTLCVVGQNPSAADEHVADKTIRYLEELIYRNRPEYSALLMLNLYSRVDTTKSETTQLLHESCTRLFSLALDKNDDFLLVYGKLKNEGAYRFPERAQIVADALKGKRILKLDIGTSYPPHPGNPRILYRNFSIPLAPLNGN